MSGYFTLQGKLCKQKNGHHKYCNGEDEVKVENPVDQIEGCGLCAVQVRAMRSEHVVQHDVEAGNDGLPVVVGVHQDLRGQEFLVTWSRIVPNLNAIGAATDCPI